jgi:small-conductance mechanosensitive channel
MRWQDIVISIAQTGFIIALLPSIRSKQKPVLFTSISYTVLICAICIALLSLHLWFSTLTAFAGAIEWAILAVQRIKADKASR